MHTNSLHWPCTITQTKQTSKHHKNRTLISLSLALTYFFAQHIFVGEWQAKSYFSALALIGMFGSAYLLAREFHQIDSKIVLEAFTELLQLCIYRYIQHQHILHTRKDLRLYTRQTFLPFFRAQSLCALLRTTFIYLCSNTNDNHKTNICYQPIIRNGGNNSQHYTSDIR